MITLIRTLDFPFSIQVEHGAGECQFCAAGSQWFQTHYAFPASSPFPRKPPLTEIACTDGLSARLVRCVSVDALQARVVCREIPLAIPVPPPPLCIKCAHPLEPFGRNCGRGFCPCAALQQGCTHHALELLGWMKELHAILGAYDESALLVLSPGVGPVHRPMRVSPAAVDEVES